ncbi:MAG: DUF4388 domain-containing protein [Deltaproteobacteria bacterium]|nr:DUF4388 domain-containing protein [Deltaproteobacteria bacterium]
MPLREKRLLVVDGDGGRGRAIGDGAERLGARVHVCGTLEEALAALQVWPADAAVVALPFGEGDSAALCGRLRRDGVRVLALAGDPDAPAVAAQAAWLGAARTLPATVAIPQLLEELRRDLSPPGAPPPEVAADLPPSEFDSLIFSWARPALEETVPTSFARPRLEPLAGPLPGAAPAQLPGAAPPLLPRGSLAEVFLPRLLAVLAQSEATGSLELVQEPVRRLLLLEHGNLVFAISNQPHERFGPRCVRAGLLAAAELAALQRSLAPGESLGRTLVARGALTAGRRTELVRAQVQEIAWSAFAWRQGSYRIALGPLPARERLDLGLRPGPFLLQGIRRAVPPERLRQELPADHTLAPGRTAPAAVGLELGPAEASLLALADGTKSVGDLLTLSTLPEEQALALLLAAACLGLLVPGQRGLASTRRIGFM